MSIEVGNYVRIGDPYPEKSYTYGKVGKVADIMPDTSWPYRVIYSDDYFVWYSESELTVVEDPNAVSDTPNTKEADMLISKNIPIKLPRDTNDPEFRAEIAEFCKDMLTWIDKGCKQHYPFSKHHGLCYNYKYWTKRNFNEPYFILGNLFEAEGFSRSDPFSDHENYTGMYTNSTRLQWLKDHAVVQEPS